MPAYMSAGTRPRLSFQTTARVTRRTRVWPRSALWSADMPTSTMTFEGFRPEAVEFLADLAQNNDRAWFQPRKADYERLLKEPLEALCVALDERFAATGIPLAADPARSPFRIYRDVRFSKDKSPYK